LLHKIDPTALRSSFADIGSGGNWRRHNCMELARRLRLHSHARHSDRSPLHDVRQRARPAAKPRARGIRLFTNEALAGGGAAGVSVRSTVWWSQTGSNRRPPACKAGALPTELWPHQRTENGRQRRADKRISAVCIPSSELACQAVARAPQSPAVASLARAKAGGPGKI
jgi:hypothetical protein